MPHHITNGQFTTTNTKPLITTITKSINNTTITLAYTKPNKFTTTNTKPVITTNNIINNKTITLAYTKPNNTSKFTITNTKPIITTNNITNNKTITTNNNINNTKTITINCHWSADERVIVSANSRDICAAERRHRCHK
jgi:hypothetical protein